MKDMKTLVISCLESRIEEDGVMYGRFLFGHAPRGLGVTIATALRRSLLSEVSGYAITHVEFCGPEHEYSTIPGTQETVLDVLLNLKKLNFTSTATRRRRAIGYCSVRGPGVITGRDLRLPPGMQCTNPDQVIARLAADGHLQFSFLVALGKNYVIHKGAPTNTGLRSKRRQLLKLADRIEKRRSLRVNPDIKPDEGARKGTRVFSIDATFMPVLKVNYIIQSDEDVLEYPLTENSLEVTERVIFEIWTDGNVTPREAMHQAATHLIRLFSLFQISTTPTMLFRPSLFKEHVAVIEQGMASLKNPEHRLQSTVNNNFLSIDIGILPLSPALYAQLKSYSMEHLGSLLGYTYEELLQIPGMTSEVLFEVLCILRQYGIRFLPKTTTSSHFPPQPLRPSLVRAQMTPQAVKNRAA